MGMAREQYYFEGETGGQVSGPFHTERDCPELSESVRPIHAELVDLDEREVCSECVPLQSDSESESGTCDVVMNSGEVCGRDLPCPYHSD